MAQSLSKILVHLIFSTTDTGWNTMSVACGPEVSTPFQGLVRSASRLPRALPWADVARPFRAVLCIRRPGGYAEAQARARKELPRLTEAIRDDARVRRAVLFGSLAKNKFHAHSDIDIAVEGLNLFERDELRQHLETLTEFPVDVRDMNSTPEFRELVEFYGEMLYAKP